MSYYTLTQMINAKLLIDKAKLNSARIKDLIERDVASSTKLRMFEGIRYYGVQHDILKHKNLYYLDSQLVEDQAKANNRVTHPFHQVLVNQKADYIVGKPLTIGVEEPKVEDPRAPSESEQAKIDANKEFIKALKAQLGDGFDDLVNEWVVGASNKGVEWLHVYIDPEGDLRYVVVSAEECIPIYDTQYEDRLVGMIRYYTIELIDEAGKVRTRYKVEWWTKDTVEYWAQNEDGEYLLDTDYEINPAPHWVTFNTQTPSEKKPHGWGRVPFVPLYNNTAATTDLEPIKTLVDAYDKVKSGWINDLDDFAEIIWVLRGYAGISSESQQGLSELAIFVKNLKTHKAINVDNDGGVDPVKAEIPVEAKEKLLQITRKEIFYFGEGVDVANEEFQTPSGVALKFLYAALDLKSNRVIRKLQAALSELMSFVLQYMGGTEKVGFEPDEISFTPNKSVIFNELEKVQMLASSAGMLSKRTILENHPLVNDPEEEMKRLRADEEERMEQTLAQLEAMPSQPSQGAAEEDGDESVPTKREEPSE